MPIMSFKLKGKDELLPDADTLALTEREKLALSVIVSVVEGEIELLELWLLERLAESDGVAEAEGERELLPDGDALALSEALALPLRVNEELTDGEPLAAREELSD